MPFQGSAGSPSIQHKEIGEMSTEQQRRGAGVRGWLFGLVRARTGLRPAWGWHGWTGVLCAGAAIVVFGGITVTVEAGRAAAASSAEEAVKSLSQVLPSDPLPQDTGKLGLEQMLRRLSTTERIMQTVAHPDDEDGGMLTLESRGEGASVLLMTMNRGEGGQNKIGSNLFDVLGVLRTLELLASDRYYGVEQRFSHVVDFGYSKSAEETFQKWGGHDIALGDMVRVIRTFRPDVLIARFSGTERDGHGNHQASSILTQEAFRAAGDPKRFPEQIKEGLLPWQPKKLYIGNVCGFMAMNCGDANYTVRLNTGVKDPLLGMAPIQFAMEGLRHQLSQGAGGWTVEPGDRFTYYKLMDSVLATGTGGHEKDFSAGLDTSLPGLASRLGEEEKKVPFLRPGLVKLQGDVQEAKQLADEDPAKAAKPLLTGLGGVQDLISETLRTKALSAEAQKELLVQLRTKESQFQQAVNLALGLSVTATADTAVAANPEDAFMAVPGQVFGVTARVRNGGKQAVAVKQLELEMPKDWRAAATAGSAQGALQPGQEMKMQFRVTVAENAEYSRPYWHRTDAEKDSVYTIDDPRYVTLPFPPPPLGARASYTVDGVDGAARTTVTVGFKDTEGRQQERALAVAPAFSVAVEPSSQVIPTQKDGADEIKVGVQSELAGAATGHAQLTAPHGWIVTPPQEKVDFGQRGERKECTFQMTPAAGHEGRYEVKAAVDGQGKAYAEGFYIVTRDDLNTFYYYQPATQRVSVVEVKIPEGLKVGYVMGAGDTIPTVLQQIGMNVSLIPAEKLGTEDLGQYGTIVLGIRAYDTQKDLLANNQRLLDYVSGGGTLIVQYNTGTGTFNGGKVTPYPAELSHARVSVEEAPVEVLAPGERVFHYPNEITQHDFDGWVQERGLYFMSSWDSHFTPLLASHDPGESEQKGGLLMAKYGKGTYIYTGYAFFRQLPAGVPGAVRLYVNLLAAGH